MRSREIIPLIQPLDLTLKLPGSKSITNRAFLCSALACGKSRVYGALESDDTGVMLKALNTMGIKYRKTSEYIEISGTGGSFKRGKMKLNLGASGTALRFLTAIMTLRDGETTICGDKRMMERPMNDLLYALEQLGMDTSNVVPGIFHVIKINCTKSSQFLSALLMLGPMLTAGINIEITGNPVSKPYVDTTIAVMKAFGVRVKNESYKRFIVKPQAYKPVNFTVEGDATSAGYFSAIKYLHTGRLNFKNLDCKKSIQGDIYFPHKLKELSKKSPRTIDMRDMPDTAMTLAICALFANGTSKITGLSTLRYKETDRLKALENELKKVGAKVFSTRDSLTVTGSKFRPSRIKTYSDHRMAMCFAVLGTRVPGIEIENPDCVSKTYPNFWKDFAKIYKASIKVNNRHLVLIGMRSSGKTKYGKKIAKKLERKFVDLDTEIEIEEGMTIDEMVKKHGWSYFRKAEQKICSKIYEKYQKPLVLATGGGVVLNEKNMKNLKRNAMTVFLYVNPDQIAARLSKYPKGRPSLTGRKLEKEILDIWNERRELYLKYADQVLTDFNLF